MAREGVNANQVFATGFPNGITESDLYLFFGSYGEVTTVKLLHDKRKQILIGAFITFRDCRCANLVLEEQQRREIFFHNQKIFVREAYADKQGKSGGGGRDYQRQTSGPAQPQAGERRGFGTERDDRQQTYRSSSTYDRGYASGTDTNRTSYGQQQSAYAPATSPATGYSSTGLAATPGYSVDRRAGDSYATRRDDGFSQGYSSSASSRAPSYADSSYTRAPQTGFDRQDSAALDNSRQYDDRNRSGYADDYNRSVGGESTRLQQSGGLTSWGDIMDREDRFTERRTADRSFERRESSMNPDPYSRDAGVAVRRDDFHDTYSRDSRPYERPSAAPVYDGNRSGGAPSAYDNYTTADGYRAERQAPAPTPSSYTEPPRYTHEPPVDRYRDPGMDRPVTYVREPQMPPAHGYGREPERYDDRDTRKRGSEWVGGFEESPRKQLAVPDPNDRPTVYSARDQGSPFMHTVNRYEPRPEAPNTFVGNEPMSRGGPETTSTPRNSRFEPSEPRGQGRSAFDRHDPKSGFVGGPDRKSSGRGRLARRGGAFAGPNARQPVNQGRLQGEPRPSDRRGWVGGGASDSDSHRMMNNLSPQHGMNQGMGADGFHGGMMQPQGMMGAAPQVQQQAMMQQQQMELMKRQQQQQAMMQQRGGNMQQQGPGMQGIMSTLANLLQNISSRGPRARDAQQQQMAMMQRLTPLERDVVAEVRRALKVQEAGLFASAIMMMRNMTDDVIKFFVQIPQGILMKILRGATPEIIQAELAEVRNTKSYDNRDEARFHVLRKLCIVVFKVSQEQMRPPPPPGVVRSLMGPRDMYRRKVMLARRTVNKSDKAGDKKAGEKKVEKKAEDDSKKEKKDEKGDESEKTTEKKGEDKEKKEVKPLGRGGFKRGFGRGFGARGRGAGLRGRGFAMRGRGGFVQTGGRGGARRGRAGAAERGKPNGEVKKPEEQAKATPVVAKKTEAPAKKAETPVAKKPAAKPVVKKPVATTPTVKKAVVAKKTTPVAVKKTTPAKVAATKATPAKPAVKATPVKMAAKSAVKK